ncbi:hypothetical protein EZS27_034715 [termite gut metagenome]|uniref:HipA N-terminal subdomain 1 domain-containing protein n=1 Tax=termite gut metagenome TaxID=433724 RepID=A0A5J4Q0T5_9ZZZZ
MRTANVYENKTLAGELIEENSSSYIFRYDEKYFTDKSLPAINLTLPKTKREYHSEFLFSFFFNLLSEGVNKQVQLHNFKIDENITKISISGVQEKLSAIIGKGKVILTPESTQGKYIIKPIPDYKRLQYCHFMPANEHLTMQIARQVYNIHTAENAIP